VQKMSLLSHVWFVNVYDSTAARIDSVRREM
jgi:hypothetical protein